MVSSGEKLLLTPTTDVVIPVYIGLHFGDGAEKIESDNSDLTLNSGGDIDLTATTNVNLPNNVGLVLGDDGENIKGDGTDLVVTSSGVLTLTGATVLATQAITDNHVLTVDGSPNDDEYAKFTAAGLEGRTTAELITDIALVSSINFIIDGGGSVITTGIKGDVVVDFACTINSVTLLADQSGSIVVDIWKDSYANFAPLDGDSITAAAVPTISTAIKAQDAVLSGWTTAIAAGDTLRFNVDSITTCERVTVSLKVTRS